MTKFDFKNAQPPRLLPLENSFTENDYEREIKELFIEIFKKNLSDNVFDANVAGNAQLGSQTLVKRSINSDGLVLLQSDREEYSTRYLYRAWKSRNNQGRGLHFLRTYLQLLFPNLCTVAQAWQDKKLTYPSGLTDKMPEKTEINEYFLTSRVLISLTFDVNAHSLKEFRDIIRSVIPARLVPEFRFFIYFAVSVKPWVDYYLSMDKKSNIPLYAEQLYVTTDEELQFIVQESNPYLLGVNSVNLKFDSSKQSDIYLSKIIRIGQPELFVSGGWNVTHYGSYIVEGSITKIS